MCDLTDLHNNLAIELRHALHLCAEISGEEKQTKETLIAFLHKHCTIEVIDCGNWFYAAHREASPSKHPIALRADYDGVASPDHGAQHLCGHDGHSATLCAVALAIEGQHLGRNVFLLFQPAEETGTGAPMCCALFEKEHIEEIYGLHNLPSFPLGQVYTRPNTFACASRGLSIHLQGTPTHAAYPELGISPSTALGQLLVSLSDITAKHQQNPMTRCTVVGATLGEKAFGMSASRAELWLTLRSEYDEHIHALQSDILEKANKLASEHNLTISWEIHDSFPATCNHPDTAQKLLAICDGTLHETPMRWSEDFGWYLHHRKGAFFGIGAGEHHPALHTAQYEYPDELLSISANKFLTLIDKA